MPWQPFAGPVLAGVNSETPPSYLDVGYIYPLNVEIPADATVRDLALAIHLDSDFLLRAIKLDSYLGAFLINFQDANGYWLASAPMHYTHFLHGSEPGVYVVEPEWVLPAGSRIGIEIVNRTSSLNRIDLSFRGVKRFRLPK